MIKNLTPEHMRCDATSCPSLHQLEDGRLLVVGEYAIREARDAGVHHELWENAVLIEPALLDVYVAEKVRGQWLPIESAPKDRNILLSTNYAPLRVAEGWWDEPEHGEYLGDCGGACRCPEYGDTPEPSWMSTDGGFTKEHPPTHWMPLPLPPVSEG
jgi:hypothetical protein